MNMCWTACHRLLQNPIISGVIIPSFTTSILIEGRGRKKRLDVHLSVRKTLNLKYLAEMQSSLPLVSNEMHCVV